MGGWLFKGEAKWKNMGGGVLVGLSVSPVFVDSLEYHSSMIAEAVKKVIKAGKVSLERFQGLSTVRRET